MNLRHAATCAIGLAVALTVGAATPGAAQDTTRTGQTARDSTMRDSTRTHHRRATSSRRIPVSKEGTRRTSGGEVVTSNEAALAAERARQDSVMALERSRVDSLLAANAAANAARDEENARMLRALQDSLSQTRGELVTVTNRTVALSDTVTRLRTRFNNWRNHKIFGNGFYVGLGAGGTFPNGTMSSSLGYDHGLDVMVPIGWQMPNQMFGIRVDLGASTFDGMTASASGTPFNNPDPKVWSATLNATLNFPFNSADAWRSAAIYLVGGGGAYMFRDFGPTSGLAAQLGETDNTTKWGLTGGAGVSLPIIFGSRFFVESRFTNVFSNNSDNSNVTGAPSVSGSKNLRWVPVIAGVTFH